MLPPEVFQKCQNNTPNIRNICVIAHVDHGKTTLTDSLLASNSIISSKSAGEARYLDSRPDEQARGITMESSAISLFFKRIKKDGVHEDYIVNLVDSPGHIDFAGEVSTASRVCDGALVLVDAVEGVCTQTHSVLKQAWEEKVKPVLVLNKIDRLVTQLKMTPGEAYTHLKMILEQVNAITGSMFMQQRIVEDEERRRGEGETSGDGGGDGIHVDWHLEDKDDSDLYFSPEFGNVVFASAIDGWAFRIDQFAGLYSAKLGMNAGVLSKVLWGDWYLDPKNKRVVGIKGRGARALKPMFVQFVLENIWGVYDACFSTGGDRGERVEKIVSKLGLKVPPREIGKSKDAKSVIQSVMSAWMPLSTAILLAVVDKLPDPIEAQKVRMPSIVRAELPEEMMTAVTGCEKGDGVPVIGFISKIISVPTLELPCNQRRREQQSKEEREKKREGYLAALKLQKDNPEMVPSQPIVVKEEEVVDTSDTLIGFSRLYSGTIKKGDKVFILGPKYDPSKPDEFAQEIVVDRLYLLMGRELQELNEVPAGNVFGISGLEGSGILKTATIASSLTCPSLGALRITAAPIVRVALEPNDPRQMPQLVEGLKLLNQSDPCVQVIIQETGEHVIVTAGELHLERCLRDLRERFAKIEIQASEAIVPFRETVVPVLANKASEELKSFVARDFGGVLERSEAKGDGCVSVWTANKLCEIRVKALPLPTSVSSFLYDREQEIHAGVKGGDEERIKFLQELKGVISECDDEEWKSAVGAGSVKLLGKVQESLWEFGPRRVGCNILLNAIPGYKRDWNDAGGEVKIEGRMSILDIQASINSGFQQATNSGPLCNEPMMGLCFIVEDVTFHIDEETDSLQVGLLSGQVISTMKDACRLAFLDWSSRLMTATYSCEMQAPSEVLGKVYAVLNKRKGRILSEEMHAGTAFFHIAARIPVIESFGVSEELWKRTSGDVRVELVFVGFEVGSGGDPLWVPTTEEELEAVGRSGERVNVAGRMVEGVRKRKGLKRGDVLVRDAEKQRTHKSK